MRIEELSIGNFVKIKSDDNLTIVEIKEIHCDSIFGLIKGDTACDEFGLDDIEPIFIQDVIDELGFEKKVDGGFEHYEVYNNDYLYVKMEEYTDGLYYIVAKDCEMSFPANSILTSCVHTLQNFLTMVNADKNIEL